MNPDDIAKVLDTLTQRYGPLAQQTWQVMERQAVLDGQAQLIFGGVATAVTLILFGIAGKGFWESLNEYHSEGGIVGVLFSILGLLVGFFALFTLLSGWENISNPGYYAIKLLLSR